MNEKQEEVQYLPLTYQQQRAWRLCQLSDPVNYGIPIPMLNRIRGKLNVDALVRSCAEVFNRHDALRMRIEMSVNGPVQVISSAASFVLRVEDFSASEDAEDQAKQAIEQLVWQLGDISSKALFRCKLLKIDEDNHILAIVVDHLISDAYSMNILIKEICAFYNFYSESIPKSFSPHGQYSEYVLWQAEWLQSPAAESHRLHWDRCMEQQPALPRLDANQGLASFPSFVVLFISSEKLIGLKNRARSEGATIYVLLFSLYVILLSRWSAASEISVSSLVLGRHRQEFMWSIGMFASSIISIVTLADNGDFRTVLRAVRNSLVQANKHCMVPAESSRGLVIPRINFLSYESSPWVLNGLEVQALDVPLDPRFFSSDPQAVIPLKSEYPLELHLMMEKEGLRCSFYSANGSFQQDHLQKFSDDFEGLMTELI
jgi:condensation domain-containing protein